MEFEYTAKEIKKIQEGRYKGKILKHERKTAVKDGKEFELHEISFVLDEVDYPLTVAYGTTVSRDSKLGALLQRFGQSIESGKTYNLSEILKVGDWAQFLIKDFEKDGKVYSQIDKDTVKPLY